MNAAESIKAAIDKLERLTADSTRSPWHYETDDLTDDVSIWHDQEQRTHVALVGTQEETRVYGDAELIVTLHRTIDAQLRVLRAGRTAFSPDFFPLDYDLPGWVAEARALALPLAEAILGEDS